MNMANKLSKPERRAIKLFKRICLNVEKNDGAPNQLKIYFRKDEKGTSIIKENILIWDSKNKKGYPRPKNYTYIRPDFRKGDEFIEVKGNISGATWDKLSRDALNDNIRLALIRINFGTVSNHTLPFNDLETIEKEIVDSYLKNMLKSKPNQRVYLRWSNLTTLIPSPNQNLKLSKIVHKGITYPIKVISGVHHSKFPKIFYLDNEIMDKWDEINKETKHS